MDLVTAINNGAHIIPNSGRYDVVLKEKLMSISHQTFCRIGHLIKKEGDIWKKR